MVILHASVNHFLFHEDTLFWIETNTFFHKSFLISPIKSAMPKYFLGRTSIFKSKIKEIQFCKKGLAFWKNILNLDGLIPHMNPNSMY